MGFLWIIGSFIIIFTINLCAQYHRFQLTRYIEKAPNKYNRITLTKAKDLKPLFYQSVRQALNFILRSKCYCSAIP